MPVLRPFARLTAVALILLLEASVLTAPSSALPPAVGDTIVNEYAADNDAHDNDFFEFLVLGDSVNLRGPYRAFC